MMQGCRTVVVAGLLITFAVLPAWAGSAQDLIGTWALDPLKITFSPNGTYTWVDQVSTLQGEYQIEGNFLRMYYQGKPTPYLYYVEGDSLRLTGPKGNVINLRRVSGGAGGTGGGIAPPDAGGGTAPGGGSDTAPPTLLGRWQARNIQLVVEFRADGTYAFGPDQGRWRQQGRQIQFRSNNGNTSVYQFRFQGPVLQLADPQRNVLTLDRIGPPPGSGGGATDWGGASQGSATSPVVGHWSANGVDLILRSDWTYSFAGTSGTYTDDGSQLVLGYQGKNTIYRYRIDGNRLLLVDPGGNQMVFQRR
jgi:hypothetical protein